MARTTPPPEAHTLPPGRYRINGRSVYWTGRVHIGLRYEPPKVPHTAAAPQPADERLRLPLLHRLVGWWQ